MDESPKIREGQAAYTSYAVDIRHLVVLEDEGRPVAVILPYAEYQRLTVLQEQAKADWRARFRQLLVEVHAQTVSIPPEEIEADITASFEEMRRERYGHTSGH
jgi:PHD/YefM family antitoxin component YafN of YafNO toxin-antitoxin module